MITQRDLVLLLILESGAAKGRGAIVADLERGLPVEPGPLSLNVTIVREPILPSVTSTGAGDI